MVPLSPLTVPNSYRRSPHRRHPPPAASPPTRRAARGRDAQSIRRHCSATVSYSLNAAITRSSMALHPDLLDKHLLLLSAFAILKHLSGLSRCLRPLAPSPTANPLSVLLSAPLLRLRLLARLPVTVWLSKPRSFETHARSTICTLDSGKTVSVRDKWDT